MPSPAAPRQRRYPLYVHLSLLFSGLMLVTGSALVSLGYIQARNLGLAAADSTFRHIGRETQASLGAALTPVAELAELLAEHPIAHAQTLEQRLTALRTLRLMLRSQAPIAAVYVGYDDSAFFLVRLLADEAARKFFDAPAGATLLVQDISSAGGERSASWLFFDDSLRELGRRPGDPAAFDPRTRPWYRLASQPGRRVLTEPYVFFATRTPGMTVALRTGAASVVGIDVSLAGVSRTLEAVRALPSMAIALFDADRRVLAISDTQLPTVRAAGENLTLAALDDLAVPVLAKLAPPTDPAAPSRAIDAGGRTWQTAVMPLATSRGPLFLGMAVPREDLLAGARAIRTRGLLTALAVLLLALPATWMAARLVARALDRLTREAQDIRAFRFDGPAAGRSAVLEIDQLSEAMDRMRETIRRFLDIATSLGGETNFARLRDRIVRETASAARADAGLVYLLGDDGRMLEPGPVVRSNGEIVAGSAATQQAAGASPVAAALREARTVVSVIDTGTADAGLPFLGALWPGHSATLIALPLHNRANEPLGVLVLLAQGTRQPAQAQLAFAQALSANAAVAIETQRLLEARKALLDAFIRLLAGAIDAKSPYTGGHCQRVPDLTLMIAHAACDAAEGPFKDFRLSDEQWEAVQIASWLHDCGKVTTPEYVVDKATKLETLYDRIHEIRMRFEVIKRDAEVACWRRIAEGGDRAALEHGLRAELAQLDDEFRFVAECNEGGEFMAPARVARLHEIGRRTWLRTLDDRIGISREERARKERVPPPPLPVAEPLLADKPEHIFERTADERPAAGEFRMDVPERKYNRGELYNLAVGRGTLTEEERYMINHHIVQTIVMLSHLPFPRHLRSVPEIAGGHHEKMDGTGYPKRLRREEMSIPARMMAIADIFEALTAIDRPYKKGKTLSESLEIMGRMRRERHIDPDVFELFLTSGVFRRYAERYLRPEQMDAVDIARFLAPG